MIDFCNPTCMIKGKTLFVMNYATIYGPKEIFIMDTFHY